MKKLALLLSLLALGALGLVACGGGDEDTTTEPKVSVDTTTQATVPHGTATEAKRTATEAKLSREQVQELRREANRWASLFAVRDCNKYMGQPICERLACETHGVPIENCTPVSEATKESFAEATVEEIKKSKRIVASWFNRPVYEAAVKFSNGVVVVFNGLAPGAPEPPDGSCAGSGGSCSWNIADVAVNRRFVEAPRSPGGSQ